MKKTFKTKWLAMFLSLLMVTSLVPMSVYAEDNDVDIIIMAKNTKKKFTALVGSVTEHVVKRAKCIVIIIPELY